MRFTCPSCQAAFNVNEEKIPPQGANARCPKCQNTVFLPGRQPEAPTPTPPQQQIPNPQPSSIITVSCPNCQNQIRVDSNKIPPQGARLKCPNCQEQFPIHRPQHSVAPPSTPQAPMDDQEVPNPQNQVRDYGDANSQDNEQNFDSFLATTNLPISVQKAFYQEISKSANREAAEAAFKSYNDACNNLIKQKANNQILENAKDRFLTAMARYGLGKKLADQLAPLYVYVILMNSKIGDQCKSEIASVFISTPGTSVDGLYDFMNAYDKFEGEAVNASNAYSKSLNKKKKVTLAVERAYFTNYITPLGFTKEEAAKIAAITMLTLMPPDHASDEVKMISDLSIQKIYSLTGLVAPQELINAQGQAKDKLGKKSKDKSSAGGGRPKKLLLLLLLVVAAAVVVKMMYLD